MILYSDNEPRGPGGPIRVDPTKAYLRHYSNQLYLQFLAKNSDDAQERGQARRELAIAERKMAYHYRTADRKEILQGIQKLRKEWKL